MNRRSFLQLAGATAGASVMNSSTVLPQGSKSATPRKGLMKVGTQHGSSDDILEVLCSLGGEQHLQLVAFGKDGCSLERRAAHEAARAG
jgi:hypothetical protein